MHDIFKWNYVVSCPIHLPHLWLDRKISMSYFLGQAHSHIYWQSQIILKCRGYIILFKDSKIAILFPMFLSRTLSLMIYWYKKCTVSSCYVIKENSIFEKKNNCMPKIEEHPIVFYWILKMWEADFDSGILIKLVVFLIKQNSKFLQLLFYEYCTQCYFRPVLFLLRVIFSPCYFPPSSLANGLTPSWIRQDEFWFKEKYRNTRHEKSPIFIIARWLGGQRGRK